MIYVVSINLHEKNHVTREEKKTLGNNVVIYITGRFTTSDYLNNVCNKEHVRHNNIIQRIVTKILFTLINVSS